MGKARHRIGFDIETTGIWLIVGNNQPYSGCFYIGFDIETTGIWLIVSDNFPSWEMLGNFIEISGTR